jgi:enterochelin esterase-like enzyme
LQQKNQSIESENTQPFILGLIDQIQSKELAEKRILNIYLPEGYNTKDTVQYPVIYLLDGSADEGFYPYCRIGTIYTFDWIHQIPKPL